MAACSARGGVVLLGALLHLVAASVPLTNQRTFGHSVKNGPLPAHTEVTTFEHNCSLPPCVITQIHVPSIYPPRGEPWNWTHGIINIYVDGEVVPSISITLLELAGESRFNNASSNAQDGNPGGTTDGSPWGIDMMGRTAKSGAVQSTVRIPFGKSVKTTIQSPPSSNGQAVYWMIVRGVEGLPVILGDFELPPSARLRIHRVNQTVMQNLQLITLANVSSGTNGAIIRVNFDATGPSFGYLEACMRLVTDGGSNPIFLSSGAEDYFLSASYFDEGMFKTPNSGLTFFEHDGKVGAYKTHTNDPVLFHNGMQLIFRRSESTSGCGDMEHCPNQYCPPGVSHGPTGCRAYSFDQEQLDRDLARRQADRHTAIYSSGPSTTNYSEYYLGEAGKSCTEACPLISKDLKCNWQMNLGDIPTMLAHLNVSHCWQNGTEGPDKVGMKWYAPDQPGYIPLAINPTNGDKEPNYRECMGFVDYPSVSNCDAKYPTNSRVCHCTITTPGPAPPAPAPSPSSADVVYNTLVWTYEWSATSQTTSSTGDVRSALTLISNLGSSKTISQKEEDVLVDAVLNQDPKLLALAKAFALPNQQAQFVRHAKRHLQL